MVPAFRMDLQGRLISFFHSTITADYEHFQATALGVKIEDYHWPQAPRRDSPNARAKIQEVFLRIVNLQSRGCG